MDLLVDADILACQFAYAYEARRGGGGTRAIVDADMMDPEAQDDWCALTEGGRVPDSIRR